MDHDAMLKQMAGRPISDFIKPEKPEPVPAGAH
jgi:hypothetical protein